MKAKKAAFLTVFHMKTRPIAPLTDSGMVTAAGAAPIRIRSPPVTAVTPVPALPRWEAAASVPSRYMLGKMPLWIANAISRDAPMVAEFVRPISCGVEPPILQPVAQYDLFVVSAAVGLYQIVWSAVPAVVPPIRRTLAPFGSEPARTQTATVNRSSPANQETSARLRKLAEVNLPAGIPRIEPGVTPDAMQSRPWPVMSRPSPPRQTPRCEDGGHIPVGFASV